MNDENLTQGSGIEQNGEYGESPEQLSQSEAMTGVLTSPGETYETISKTPKKNYWIIPVLITLLAGVIATFLFMQDAELVNKTMEKQRKTMQESFDKNVKEGKMKQEDADKAMEGMDPKGMMFKIFGYGFAVIGPFLIFFILSLSYLILLKIMKAQFEFSNVMNVVGLSMLIMAIASLIGIVISIFKGEMSGLGLSLFSSEESAGAKVYGLLSRIDVFSIWFYIVVGIGLSKIAKLETVKSIVIAFVPYIVYILVTFIFA